MAQSAKPKPKPKPTKPKPQGPYYSKQPPAQHVETVVGIVDLEVGTEATCEIGLLSGFREFSNDINLKTPPEQRPELRVRFVTTPQPNHFKIEIYYRKELA